MRAKILTLIVVAVCLPAVAQIRVSNPEPSYEGQKVGAITVAANPHLNTDSYLALIVQRAGEPFSNEKVQESMDRLKGTHAFSDVRLQVEPEVDGLKLTFILEPAYYIGMLTFPGGVGHFSYSRLLQVVNLPDQSVFQESNLATARQALVKFFAENGFFRANVSTEVQLDDRNQLAHVAFDCQTGPHARVGKVEVGGATAEENRRLERTMRSLRARFTGAQLKPGTPYSPRRIQAATALIRANLARRHYPDNKIVVSPPEFHPETNLADVAIHVDTGPPIEIRVVGARLTWIPFQSGRRKRRLITIYDEGSIDPDIIEESRRNLLDYFQRKGYFDVNVTTSSEQQDGKTILSFQIDRGPRYAVNDIAFAGNHHVSNRDLTAQIGVKKRRRFISRGLYSEKLLRDSGRNIENSYRDLGFENAKVTGQAFKRNQAVYISFDVSEGERTIVGSLQVEGNKSIPLHELLFNKKSFALEEGKPFSPRRLSDDRNRIAAQYLNRGFLNSSVNTMVEAREDDPHKVDVTYVITENQQVRIARVAYMGYSHTQLPLLRRSTVLRPEQPLSQTSLLQGESNLYDAGIFDWASVGPKRQISDQGDEEVLIKVHEAKRNSVTYGFGLEVSRRGGNVPSGSVAVPGLPTIGLNGAKVVPSDKTFVSPRGSIDYSRLNMRGLGETASFSLLVARLDQRAIASYTTPHFRGSSWQALTSFSYERTTENPLFEARLEDASLQFQRFLDRKKRYQLQLRYDFNHTTLTQLIVPELVLPPDRNVKLSFVSGSVIRDTRDKPLDAHRGVYFTTDFRLVATALGSSANFARLFTQYAFYKEFHSMVFANSMRLGLAVPYSGSMVPTSQRFFAGGGTSLRGFPIDEAGPVRNIPFCPPGQTMGCPLIPIPIGGDQLFILNSELRYPIPIISNLGGVVFYDGGNVYSRINFPEFVNNYSNTLGLGLRYNTPIGPVRFDVGRNLSPIHGISGTQFFITLGQAF